MGLGVGVGLGGMEGWWWVVTPGHRWAGVGWQSARLDAARLVCEGARQARQSHDGCGFYYQYINPRGSQCNRV